MTLDRSIETEDLKLGREGLQVAYQFEVAEISTSGSYATILRV